MKCASLKIEILKQKYFFILLSFILSFLIYRGRLGADDLQAFDASYALVEVFNLNFFGFIENESNAWQFGHRLIWILQNVLIILFLKIINIFISFDLEIVSSYFCGWIITFYTFLAYFLFIKVLNKNKISLNLAFFISTSIFFGTSFISFFTGMYIESLVVLIIILRFLIENPNKNLILDILLTLIKPYYFLVVICLAYNNYGITKYTLKYIIFIGLITALQKLLLLTIFQSFVTTLPINFELNFIIKNIFDIFFSFGFGLIFTSTIIIFLIIFGSDKKTFVKFIFIFMFILLLSILPFWHGQSPGGRYILSFLFIFLPEIIRSLLRIKKLNNFKLIFFTIYLITLLNLPTLEYRNTNIKNYQDSAASNKIAKNPSDRNVNSFPVNDISFNNIIFAHKILWSKIKNDYENKITIENYTFQIKDSYPMTGLKRIIFIHDNKLDYLNGFMGALIKKNIRYLEYTYYFLFFFFIILFTKSLTNCLRKNEN